MPTIDSPQVTPALQEPSNVQVGAEVTPPQPPKIHVPLITIIKVVAAFMTVYD